MDAEQIAVEGEVMARAEASPLRRRRRPPSRCPARAAPAPRACEGHARRSAGPNAPTVHPGPSTAPPVRGILRPGTCPQRRETSNPPGDFLDTKGSCADAGEPATHAGPPTCSLCIKMRNESKGRSQQTSAHAADSESAEPTCGRGEVVDAREIRSRSNRPA